MNDLGRGEWLLMLINMQEINRVCFFFVCNLKLIGKSMDKKEAPTILNWKKNKKKTKIIQCTQRDDVTTKLISIVAHKCEMQQCTINQNWIMWTTHSLTQVKKKIKRKKNRKTNCQRKKSTLKTFAAYRILTVAQLNINKLYIQINATIFHSRCF